MAFRPTHPRRRLLAVVLAAVACGPAHAAPAVPAAAPTLATVPVAVEAVEIASRLGPGRGQSVPDVVDVDVAQADRRLARRGLDVQVVAFGQGRQVTAQYPGAGDAAPPDGRVTVWLGTPPKPLPAVVAGSDAQRPASVSSEPPVPTSLTTVRAQPEPSLEEDEPSATPAESEPSTTPAPRPEPDPAQGPDTTSAPPRSKEPPRSNIREMPPAPAGQTLTGTASWYGAELAGHPTACGGPFDPGALTLASRELRCGTRVRVTGPSGATVDAVVTDWGPAEWTGRRFDLSQAAFAAIHHLGAGVVDVTVEVLG